MSNWQMMGAAVDGSSSKVEPEAVTVRFARILINEPAPSDVYTFYGNGFHILVPTSWRPTGKPSRRTLVQDKALGAMAW